MEEARQPAPLRPRTTTLPALMEELVEEILLRIPPEEPAHHVRAALVCRRWRRILCDPGFLRRYCAFHRRRPPLLGFFYNHWSDPDLAPSFAPAAAAFPSLPEQEHHLRRAWCVLDCRHGRVLLENMRGSNLMVWDPMIGGGDDDGCQELQSHDVYCYSYTAAVLCAVAGCDHHDCRSGGGPFLVVYLGADATDEDDVVFTARVYSSEARAWGTPVVSSQLGITPVVSFSSHTDWDLTVKCSRAAVIGDEVYCVVMPGARILKYNHVEHSISSFSLPPPATVEPLVLMQNEDGSLGLACQRDATLHLWSSSRMMVLDRDGKLVAEWVQGRVIELDKILPPPIVDTNKHRQQVYVTGFAEGVGVLFISTNNFGTFTFELKSGRVRKISMPIDFHTAFPFISFFTPSM